MAEICSRDVKIPQDGKTIYIGSSEIFIQQYKALTVRESSGRHSISWHGCWRIEDKGTYASKENSALEEEVRDFRFDCN